MEFRALVLTVATFAPLTVPDGDARFDGSAVFEPVSSEVAIPHGPSGAWNGRYTDPGAVVVHDGLLHAFPNGFAAWPAPVGVATRRSHASNGPFHSRRSTTDVFASTFGRSHQPCGGCGELHRRHETLANCPTLATRRSVGPENEIAAAV